MAFPKPPGQALRCGKEAERDNLVGHNLIDAGRMHLLHFLPVNSSQTMRPFC
jgi:hypothetical protein